MHHKRRPQKSRRAGCVLCRPHKANGCCAPAKDVRIGNRPRYEAGNTQMRCEEG